MNTVTITSNRAAALLGSPLTIAHSSICCILVAIHRRNKKNKGTTWKGGIERNGRENKRKLIAFVVQFFFLLLLYFTSHLGYYLRISLNSWVIWRDSLHISTTLGLDVFEIHNIASKLT